MTKIINVDGHTLEPGYLTHNGKRYRFLTTGSDEGSLRYWVGTFHPEMQKNIVIANVDLTSYLVFGRKTSRLGLPKVTVIKTPAKHDTLKTLGRYLFKGDEYKSLFGLDRGVHTVRGSNYATSLTQARKDVKHYLNLVKADKKQRLPQYNEFVILKVLYSQYHVYGPEKK